MKKFLVCLASLGLTMSVLAETDYIAIPILRDIQRGENNRNRIEDLLVGDDATINDDATISGDLMVIGTTTIGATTVTTVNATGGITSDGDIDAGTNQVEADQLALSTNGTEVGFFAIVQSTQLVFIVGANTNVIDSDIEN